MTSITGNSNKDVFTFMIIGEKYIRQICIANQHCFVNLFITNAAPSAQCWFSIHNPAMHGTDIKTSDKNFAENSNAHTQHFFSKLYLLCDNQKTYCYSQKTYRYKLNTEDVYCILDTLGYKICNRISNIYCFSTAKITQITLIL
jgi:hypothetical protein